MCMSIRGPPFYLYHYKYSPVHHLKTNEILNSKYYWMQYTTFSFLWYNQSWSLIIVSPFLIYQLKSEFHYLVSKSCSFAPSRRVPHHWFIFICWNQLTCMWVSPISDVHVIPTENKVDMVENEHIKKNIFWTMVVKQVIRFRSTKIDRQRRCFRPIRGLDFGPISNWILN